jgi:hypothetical protein
VSLASLSSKFSYPAITSSVKDELLEFSTKFVRTLAEQIPAKSDLFSDCKAHIASKDAEIFLSLLSKDILSSVSTLQGNTDNQGADERISERQQNIFLQFVPSDLTIKHSLYELFGHFSREGELDVVLNLLRILHGMSMSPGNQRILYTDDKIERGENDEGVTMFSSDHLICKIMHSVNLQIKPFGSVTLPQSVYKKLMNFSDRLPGVSSKYEELFLASKVAAFFRNMSILGQTKSFRYNFEHENANNQLVVVKEWETSLHYAHIILNASGQSLDDSSLTGKDIRYASPLIYHAIVKGLCGIGDESSVEKAHSIICEAETAKLQVDLNTYVVLLRAATSLCDDSKLSRVIKLVENKYPLSSKLLEKSQKMLESLLLSNSRLSRGIKSLAILKTMREKGISPSKSMYLWTINSLVHLSPSNENEWRLLLEPKDLTDCILNDMLKDGVHLDFSVVISILKLFRKSCYLAKAKNIELKGYIDWLQSFFDKVTCQEYLGHPRIPVREEYLVQILKGYCYAGFYNRAVNTAENLERLHGVKPTALIYEPLLYHLSVVNGALRASDDLFTSMLNKSIKPTVNIVNAVLLGSLKYHDNEVESIEKAQDLYNQHNVRPSPSVLLKILDKSLKKSNIYEAKRAVAIIQQLYPDINCSEDVKRSSYFHSSLGPVTDKQSELLLSKDAFFQRFKFYGLNFNGL